MKCISFVLLAITCFGFLGCRERLDVIIKTEDGKPIKGAVVANTGEQYRCEIATDENGLAILEKKFDIVGVSRIDVTYLNVVYWGFITNNDECKTVIFTPALDIWKVYSQSGTLVRSEKSLKVLVLKK